MPDEAARFHAMKRLGTNGAPIPHNALLNAKAQADAMRGKRGPADDGIVGWEWLGPGNVGGRIRALYVENNPAHAGFMMIGATGGGIWRSTDSGAEWTPVGDFLSSLAVTAFAVDKSNPDSPVFYAATGEGFVTGELGNANLVRGAGVFVSSDWGEHWAQLASTNNASFYWVNDLAVSPTFPPAVGPVPRIAPRPDGVFSPVLLAATLDGLKVSANGGASWATPAIMSAADIADVKFSPNVPLSAVAGTLNGEAYFSTDMGLSWSRSTWTDNNGNPLAAPNNGRVELAFDPSVPNRIYASVVMNGPSPQGRVFRSQNGGATFRLLWSHSDVFAYSSGSIGNWFNTLWVAPHDRSLILLGGIDLWRSTDFGNTFTRVTAGNGVGATAMHADHSAIVPVATYDASNRAVYVGNDGGLFLVPDVSGTPVSPSPVNNGLGITQFYAGAIDAQGRIAGGAQDNGNSYVASGGSPLWSPMGTGDGGFIQCHPAIPDAFFVTTQDLRVSRRTGSSFQTETVLLASGSVPSSFIAPILLDPVNADYLFAGGERLWRLDDPGNAVAGATWTSLPNSFAGAGNRISAIAVAPLNPDEIWLGYSLLGTVRRSVDGGATWDACGNLPNRWVSDIEVVDTLTAYVTLMGFAGDNVWKTIDGGATWEDISGSGADGLPSLPVSTIAIGPCDRLFVGTDLGVFASNDGGTTWIAPASGPVNVQVDQLFWDGFDRSRLFAATFGRGMWEAAILNCCGSEQVIEARPQEMRMAHSGAHLIAAGPDGDDVRAWERTAGVWIAAGELVRPAGTPYVLSCDVDGNRAVVGWGTAGGSKVFAYHWDNSIGAWVFDEDIVAPGMDDWPGNSAFGQALSISGNSLVVSAPGYELQGGSWANGAAVFFRHDGVTWVEDGRVFGHDTDVELGGPGDVAIHGTTATLTAHDIEFEHASTYQYIYERNPITQSWELAHSIYYGSGTYLSWGKGTCAIEGNVMAFAAVGDDEYSVRVVERDPITGDWDLASTQNTQGYDLRVSLSQGMLAIGDYGANNKRGRVKILEKDEDGWKTTRTFSSVGNESRGYGWHVSLSANTIWISSGLEAGHGKLHYIGCVR